MAGDELQTLSPIDKLCWTFAVHKCQYCLTPATDTLHLLMKVCASPPSCFSCLLHVRVTLEGGALGAWQEYALDTNWLRVWLHNGNHNSNSQVPLFPLTHSDRRETAE